MPTYKKFEDMIEAAREAILDSSEQSSVYIGCDSMRRKKNNKFFITYATVIILHRDTKHGGNIFAFVETVPDYTGSMKQRLIEEAGYAVRTGTELVDYLGKRPLEIHLDLNPNPKHKSSCAVQEATGWVLGTFGIKAKIKPYSFAATSAADHIVRH